mgnify:CR=1 FL=1
MVDDGSSDASGKICDEYAQEYENFFVVHKENAGLGLARNTGLEYIITSLYLPTQKNISNNHI